MKDLKKENIIATARNLLQSKLIELEKAIFNVQNAANEESKSSMGDKYETGRAMAQNDRAMLENQKNELLKDISTFENINFEQETEFIKSGSLVQTSIGYILVSVSLGKIVEDGVNVMLISSASPLGTELTGKKIKDSVTMNSRPIQILAIY
ncbi:3-oxoacyl-ACP synthase [Lacihabitans soyangensis]|uniref:3-oxoacyl-ACP synthase n=1 Tax=Lacihabitans soyangensis TaxID=869394 RepID=A0AAE3GZX6_9BACT|nr:3-oxoacyl-ACP synthase [Lacihabitans soyangensis]